MRTLSAWTLLALFSLLAVKGLGEDLDLSDAFDDLPATADPKPKPKEPAGGAGAGGDDLDLSDAMNPSNDIGGKGKDTGKGSGTFSDNDLVNVGNDDSYKPDEGKGRRGAGSSDLDSNDGGDYDTMAETGTIAGIVSAVAMALVGAVSSYISYQKKKFCFSIQQSLNADMVKADNPEAVVAQEPQVQQTLLQPPNAEPPTEDNAV
ncbi:CD99 antigen-like protein 2 isoform X4 [Salminus brasiliensis]|uniref:CD99 antigen-like protein 2 isoform X4 n=1 Tax=Salminus brasiliensis TaxID=930266 RepID=UPI003B83918B